MPSVRSWHCLIVFRSNPVKTKLQIFLGNFCKYQSGKVGLQAESKESEPKKKKVQFEVQNPFEGTRIQTGTAQRRDYSQYK